MGCCFRGNKEPQGSPHFVFSPISARQGLVAGTRSKRYLHLQGVRNSIAFRRGQAEVGRESTMNAEDQTDNPVKPVEAQGTPAGQSQDRGRRGGGRRGGRYRRGG